MKREPREGEFLRFESSKAGMSNDPTEKTA